jgi:hypothetical protein
MALTTLGQALRENNFNVYNTWLKTTLKAADDITIGLLTNAGEAMAFSVWWGTLRAEIRKLRDKIGVTR